MKQCLTFDDVLLVPQYSDVVPTGVDTCTNIAGIRLGIPIFSSAMDTVTSLAMAKAIGKAGGMGILHKNMSKNEQSAYVEEVKTAGFLVGMAVGVFDWRERIAACMISPDVVVVDSAHGHSKNVLEAVYGMKSTNPGLKIMAGNVVTQQAVKDLHAEGADIIKVGVGPSGICTTRTVSGCGVPQFTAIRECAEAANALNIPIIADGGIKNSGDIVKALAAGADAVMIGGLLAGTDEAPGERFCDSTGKPFKSYRGMGSIGAMQRGSKDRYGQSEVEPGKLVPEGVEAAVPYRGPVSKVLHQLVGGLRAGMGYVGAKNLSELQTKAQFIQVTQSGVRENGVHDVELK